MGDFTEPTWAYMVPSLDGKPIVDDPDKVGVMHIYKIRPNQVEAFKAKWDMAGWVWNPIYSLLDGSNHPGLPAPLATRPNKGKDKHVRTQW